MHKIIWALGLTIVSSSLVNPAFSQFNESDQDLDVAFKDVIITEILADPLPSVGLPEAEFVEIFNRSESTINLGGWSLSDEASSAELPSVDLPPREYAVITASGDVPAFGSVRIVPVSRMPTLNNSEDAVVLRSFSEARIDSVRYSSTWYRDVSKRAGGWSLELIDPSNSCAEEDNWAVSEALEGGTPGKQNSIFASKPDGTGPHIVAVTATGPATVRIDYDEKLSVEEVSAADVIIEPKIDVASVELGKALRSLEVTLSGTLQAGQLYFITVQNIRDCNHNMASEERIPLAMPEAADSLDVVINEILFNPEPGGVDFVELFNRSKKFINLKGWGTAEYSGGTPENFQTITEGDRLLAPGAYAVVTTDAVVLLNQYPDVPPETLVEARLISLPDDAGSVALVDADQKVVDAVTYRSDMHSIFITAADGVSLERISVDAASQDADNWQSASTHYGGATPGQRNSVEVIPSGLPLNAVSVEPAAFRPVYGKPNFALIRYNFDQAGYVANAKILDQRGRCIRSIASNDLLGAEGFYRWDGDRDDGSRARIGCYWLWMEVFSQSGDVRTFRERIIIAGDF